MTRRNWLLLLIGFEGAPQGLDPVRLQKAMFLFAHETDIPAEEKYEFRPYNYGPMSRDIYDDLDFLVEHGLVEGLPVEGQSWARYNPTTEGVARGHELLDRTLAERSDEMRALYDLKHSVVSMSFNELLQDVYDRYPEFASQSLFRPRA